MTSIYKTVSLTDLKDSRILYDKNPPSFGVMLIGIVALSILGTAIWSTSAVKSYVVKGSGMVNSIGKNYIMSSYTGEITEAYVSEGDFVEKGDILFQISSTDLDLQAEQLMGMISAHQKKIARYEWLEACIKENRNTFDENNPADKPYYYQYETYKSQVAAKEVDITAYKSYGYTDDQIEVAIRTNEAAVAEIYYSTLKSIADSVQTLKNEISSYEIQLASIHTGQSAYPILANATGIVHMDTEYKTGMVVQAAAAIGSIVSENEYYNAVVYVSANDMPLIHIGDTVRVAVSGLTQSIYGTIDGTVTYIASEATVNSEEKTSSFMVKIALDSTYLISNKGTKVNISNGMAVEARIVYDEVTYMDYLLETIGILTR